MDTLTPSATPAHAPLILVARVSTDRRAELLLHVDTALTPHLHRPYVREVYEQVKQHPEVLERGTIGEQARVDRGWVTVYAPGGSRDLGARVDRGSTTVLFLTASAVARAGRDRDNAFLQIMEELLRDPRFVGGSIENGDLRCQIVAPMGDRLVRDRTLGWQLFDAATAARAVFLIGSNRIDTCAENGKDLWTFVTMEGASSRDSTVKRLTTGELNYARAGLYPGSERALPVGYRWQQEPASDGRWRPAHEASEKTTIRHHVEPDPESWWQVEALIRLALDPHVTTWRNLAHRLGEHGFTARGADEEDVPSSVELRWRPSDHQAAFTESS